MILKALRVVLGLVIATAFAGCAMTPTGIKRTTQLPAAVDDANTAVVYSEWINSDGWNTVVAEIDGVALCPWRPCQPVFRVTPGDHTISIIFGYGALYGKVGDATFEAKNLKAGHVYQIVARTVGRDSFRTRVIDLGPNVKQIDTRDSRFGSGIVQITF